MPLETVVTLLLGGSFLAALGTWYKNHADKRAGVKAQALAESTAKEEWWQERIKLQVEVIIEPMQAEIENLRKQVETLQQRIEAQDAEIEAQRTRYWLSIRHIRDLHSWAGIHAAAIEIRPPGPPPVIAADVGLDH